MPTRRAVDRRRTSGAGIWLAAAALLALGCLAGADPAAAKICSTDAVPGATLLLPYFEVNLDDPNGLTTLFSVDNASATAIIAHAVVWSDLAVPVFSFDVYLTGYDVQTFNLRDLIGSGALPQTATFGQDPGDLISPKGQLSQDLNFHSCDGKLPPAPMSAGQLAHVQAALTGRPSPLAFGLCLGRNLGDRVARGYVTVDTVRDCTARLPGDAGYFADGAVAGDATDQNVLWGTWYIVNSAHDYAQGSNLVAIEADAANPAVSAPGRYSFYGRYVGWTGADHREPLATSFAAQFAVPSTFSGQVDLIVWRDLKQPREPFVCPTAQAPGIPGYPFAQEALQVFDEQEHPVERFFVFSGGPIPTPLLPFPAAAQRTRVNSPTLPVPYFFGWLYLDLNETFTLVGNDPASDPAAAQAWVVAVQSADGRFATAVDAYRLDSACNASHFGQQISF
jgi:hypothetical protein